MTDAAYAQSASGDQAATTQAAPPAPVDTDPQIGDVVVTGIRASLKASQDIKRNSDFEVDAITAEDVGKFPSRNVADALQQIPGVAISTSGGEGQQVTVRGLGPEFNTVLWNGRRIATDAGGRAFNFDTIPSDLLGGVEMTKTSDVSLQEGGIGSTINLKTLRPLDMKGDMEAVLSARGDYDKTANRLTPEVFGLFSAKFADGRIGVLLAASYQDRKSVNQYAGEASFSPIDVFADNDPTHLQASDVFADGKGNGAGTYWVPAKLTNDVINEDRKRYGLNGSIQAKLSSNLTLTLDGMYDKFTVTSDGIEKAYFGNPSNIVPNSLITSADNTITRYSFINGPEFVKLNYDRSNQTYAYGGNLSWSPSSHFTSSLDVSGSLSRNDDGGHDQYYVIHGPDTIMTIDATHGYAVPIGTDGAIQGYDPTVFPAGSPQLAAAPPVGSTWDRNSLSGYRSWWTTREGAETRDRLFEARWDNKFEFDGLLNRIRFGADYTNQRRDLLTVNSDDVGWGNYGAMGIPLPSSLFSTYNQSNFLSQANTPLDGKFLNFNGDALINYLLSPQALALRDQINGLPPGTSASEILPRGYTAEYQPGQSYVVRERVLSAYVDVTLKGDLGNMPFTVIGGVRYTRTRESAQSSQQQLLDILYAPGSGGTQYVSVMSPDVLPITQSSRYDDWLPSVNAKLGLTDKLILRGAISKSLTRPDLGFLNPVISFPSTLRPQHLEASGGNADLKGYTSWNYDASLEWYFDRSSYISASFFHKKIDGMIQQLVVRTPFTIPNASNITNDPEISGQTAYFDVTRYVNVDKNSVSGFELAAQETFGFLPSVLQHTGITASVTLPWSSTKFNTAVFTAGNGAFPGLSKSYFVTGFYDDGRLQARVSWSRRDKFFDGFSSSTEPVFQLGRSQWDAKVSFDLTEAVQLFGDAYNFTNAPIRQTGRYSDQFLLFQQTGARYDLGVRFKF